MKYYKIFINDTNVLGINENNLYSLIMYKKKYEGMKMLILFVYQCKFLYF